MSALGHKRTSQDVLVMSALPPNADIAQHGRNVRFVFLRSRVAAKSGHSAALPIVAIHESSCDKGAGADRVEHALSSWGFYKLDKGLLTITSAAATDPYSGKEAIHQMEFRLIDHPHGGSCSLSQQ